MEHLENHVVCQIGIVVRDVEATAEKLSKMFGVPKGVKKGVGNLATDFDWKTEYKGRSADSSCYNLNMEFGSIQFELIQPIGDAPSVWQDFYDQHGEGVHHLAWKVSSTDDATELFKGFGAEKLQTGTWGTGQYSYFDTEKIIGFTVEILENFKK